MSAPAFENENTVFRMAQAGKTAEFDREYEEAYRELRKRTGETLPMLIDGQEVRTERTFDDHDPSTGEVVARFPVGSKEHVERAVAAAKRAQGAWEALGWERRTAVIEKAVEVMRARRPMLAALMTIENGKNRVEAYYDVDEAIDFLKFYAREMRRNHGYHLTLGKPFPDETTQSVMRPWGVFAVIGPFNFPVAIPTGMTVGALVTGNAVVLKPASDTPWTSYEVVRILHEAGVPGGVVNLVTGGGRDVGQPLIDHPDVDGLVFTGSREVGMRNYKEFVAKRPRPYIAEMGGKNAIVVTPRADVDKAVQGVVRSAFGFGGQKCSAASRCYVHESVYDAFVPKLEAATRKLRVDLPWKKEADLGPVINEGAVKTYLSAVESAKKAGGKVLAGGRAVKEGDLAKGNFVEPTVLTDLPEGADAFRTEYFVPVIAVAKYRDLDRVIAEVNAVEYGLTSGIFSQDPQEVQRYFDQVHAGVVYANRSRGGSTGAMVGGQSFGGWKFSATTSRGAGGPHYLLQFMREQSRTWADGTTPPGL